ncbi:DsbA family oxidoreductase [Oceanobacillus sp. CAU 1775]
MTNNNGFSCDPITGTCGEGGGEEMEMIDLNKQKKTIELYYVTDPICSHCWAIEPTLRRFIEQYGHYFNVKTVMGGLLEKWHDGPIDPANGIYKPADVAPHWREVGDQSRMPIDGSLMVDNPVQSSFPASRVFKIVQKHHGDEKAYEYLRRSREKLFAFNENIGEAEVLTEILDKMGLEGADIIKEAEGENGHELLQEDFALTRSLGARGFPSIIIVNEENQGVLIVGGRPFEYYVKGLEQVLGEEPKAKETPAVADLIKKEKLLFSKEIEVMYDLEQNQLEDFLTKELDTANYETNEILGEKYIVAK